VELEEERENKLAPGESPPEQLEPDLDGLCFEEILSRLQRVVQNLEEGNLPLEKALETFEQGIKLTRVGSRRLDEAERRIEILLTDQNGAIQSYPMDKESDTK
jgi:exodeoxyribonuclease VII small subunit